MTDRVVVLGAGYAGVGAVQQLADVAPATAEVVWLADREYHLVLHEAHRVIRNPSVAQKITIPIEEVRPSGVEFRQGHAVGVDVDAQTVRLADGDQVAYDYLLVAVGSRTAFYGIDGLREHALTLKGVDDARSIHDAVETAAAAATPSEPARVIVGGAGLSGVQAAGEIAGWRDEHDAPVAVTLVEGLAEVLPGAAPELQRALRSRLLDADIDIRTGSFVSSVDEATVSLDAGEGEEPVELDYDVLVWTGGIEGRSVVADTSLETDEQSQRVNATADFTTSDDRVFALGDTALVEQGADEAAPPTAQAAWDAATVAGTNLARAIEGTELETWTYEDRGTLASVGDRTVAHAVALPAIGTVLPRTFGGPVAGMLKKAVACRWIASVASVTRAWQAWGDM